jgi:hypothetical protein
MAGDVDTDIVGVVLSGAPGFCEMRVGTQLFVPIMPGTGVFATTVTDERTGLGRGALPGLPAQFRLTIA